MTVPESTTVVTKNETFALVAKEAAGLTFGAALVTFTTVRRTQKDPQVLKKALRRGAAWQVVVAAALAASSAALQRYVNTSQTETAKLTKETELGTTGTDSAAEPTTPAARFYHPTQAVVGITTAVVGAVVVAAFVGKRASLTKDRVAALCAAQVVILAASRVATVAIEKR